MINYKKEWAGMPRFKQEKVRPFHMIAVHHNEGKINVRFGKPADLDAFNKAAGFDLTTDDKAVKIECPIGFGELIGQKITKKTKSIWYPFRSHWGGVTKKYIGKKNQTRYPVYIVSKGRYENGLTTKALCKMGVKHFIVAEESESEKYISNKNELAEVIVLPSVYLDDYDTCDDLGDSKSKGPGAARNFCIDHSLELGSKKHWVMDDNIDAFHYLTDNEKYTVESSETLIAAEDFTDRYENVPISGLNYYSFCKKTDKVPPFITNTRIYSCLLIDNTSGYRWRGRYNEDTDLSLRVLKDGLCTIQFNAFLCGKVTTQRMRGGNSKEFYDDEGTLPKSKMIADLHPDVAKVVWRFNRWHHHVNYKKFNNKLIPTKDRVQRKPYDLKLVDK